MDPRQAKLTTQAIHDELVRLTPGQLRNSLEPQIVEKRSGRFGGALERASSRWAAPLLARIRYHTLPDLRLNLKNVHWEPGEVPSDEEWRKFEKLYHEHPGRIMIMGEDPLQRLRKDWEDGYRAGAFETCASEPKARRLFDSMKANAARLCGDSVKPISE